MNLNVIQDDGSYSIAGITDPTAPTDTTDAWSGSKVYYGKYGDTPLLFRVLDADTTDYTDSTTHTMFLDCDTVLEKVQFDSNLISNVWNNSTLKQWMNSTAISGFTQAEQDAIAASTRSEMTVEGLSGWTSNFLSWCSLDGDKVFALDAREASNPAYGYSTTDSSAANRVKQELSGSGGAHWWLRSATSFDYEGAEAGFVDSYGIIASEFLGYDKVGVSPAFNLNLSSVLFTSAAKGGKSSGAEGTGALTKILGYNGNEWKLTLLDESRSDFAIGTTAVNGNTLTVAYSGAAAGTDEYISAVVMDSSNTITYYGRIKSIVSSSDASGTAEITLPDGFDSTTDTLYLFSEQYNGDYNTDYASELQTVSQAKNAYIITNSLRNITSSNSAAYMMMDSVTDYNDVLSVSGDYVLPESITVTAGGNTLTAGTDYTYSSSTGELNIYSAAVTGDIVITASAAHFRI